MLLLVQCLHGYCYYYFALQVMIIANILFQASWWKFYMGSLVFTSFLWDRFYPYWTDEVTEAYRCWVTCRGSRCYMGQSDLEPPSSPFYGLPCTSGRLKELVQGHRKRSTWLRPWHLALQSGISRRGTALTSALDVTLEVICWDFMGKLSQRGYRNEITSSVPRRRVPMY